MREATNGQYPAIVVLENVPGLLSSGVNASNPGGDFALVLKGLSDLGAAVAYRILDAQFFGLAQRRRRVFIVASFAELDIGEQRVSQILALSDGVSGDSQTRRAARQDVAGTIGNSAQSGGFRTTDLDNNGAFIPMVARSLNFDKSHMNGGGQVAVAFQQNTRDEVRYIGGDGQIAGALAASPGMKQQNYVQQTMAVRRLTPTECSRLQGFPDDWNAYDADGKPLADSQRYRQLGNAVAVPVVEWIAKRIVEALDVS